MSDLGNEVLRSARSRIDRPFRHHFKPEDLCEGGRLTVDACMERGVDDREGYDCSGLAVASLREVLGIIKSEWPRDLRHTEQLSALALDEGYDAGDIRLYYAESGGIHLGIATDTPEVVVHASGLNKVVEESVVTSPKTSFKIVRTIAIESLAKTLTSQR